MEQNHPLALAKCAIFKMIFGSKQEYENVAKKRVIALKMDGTDRLHLNGPKILLFCQFFDSFGTGPLELAHRHMCPCHITQQKTSNAETHAGWWSLGVCPFLRSTQHFLALGVTT